MKISFRGYDLDVEINEYIPAVEGYTDGLPENCYPDEPAHISWILIDTGNELLDELLCNDYEEEITKIILKQLENQK